MFEPTFVLDLCISNVFPVSYHLISIYGYFFKVIIVNINRCYFPKQIVQLEVDIFFVLFFYLKKQTTSVYSRIRAIWDLKRLTF